MEKGEFEAAPKQVEPSQIVRYKTNKSVVFGMFLFMLISIGLGIWVVILLTNNSGQKNSNTKTDDSSKVVESEKTDSPKADDSSKIADIDDSGSKQTASDVKTCAGDYKFNDGAKVGDGLIHSHTITLKNDGTFSGSKNATTKEEGVYYIKEDTIIFAYHPSTYGGPDQPSYVSESYYISSDCSYMQYEEKDAKGSFVKNIKLSK